MENCLRGSSTYKYKNKKVKDTYKYKKQHKQIIRERSR